MNALRRMSAVLVLAAGLGSASARETILSFHSDITVHANGGMTVTETIRVRAENDRIKRGIYRDFPTTYRDRLGNRYVVGFRVLKVLRDGKPDGYHFENLRNGKRVYIGRREVILNPGEYTYEMTYETNRQLGFFEQHDELYWNVTGNGWAFPIQAASATVALPEGIERNRIRIEGYTGAQGSREQAVETGFDASGHATIKAARMLGPQEGLTLVATFPKGFVREPSRAEKLGALLGDNRLLSIALAGLVATLGYFLIAWLLVGRDPPRGTIIPRYEPPEGVSPAGARFVSRMGYDNNCFAAALIGLGVKGFLRIQESAKKQFTLHKVKAVDRTASGGERAIFERLLGSRSSLTLKQTNHHTIGGAVQDLQKALVREYRKKHFRRNALFLVPGILLTVATLAAIALYHRQGQVFFLMSWLSIWTLGVLALGNAVHRQWRQASSGAGIGGAVGITLFAVPFLIAEIVVVGILSTMISPLVVLVLVLMVVLIVLFHHLLKQPTLAGRRLMDELAGFKMYLGVAEKDTWDAMKGPEITPALFDAYLPYAFALGVDQEWSERFSTVLARAGAEVSSRARHPWYTGDLGHHLRDGALTGALGSALASAVAASSTAPGSSSGSGGGGFSGGGGGGGGGGGW